MAPPDGMLAGAAGLGFRVETLIGAVRRDLVAFSPAPTNRVPLALERVGFYVRAALAPDRHVAAAQDLFAALDMAEVSSGRYDRHASYDRIAAYHRALGAERWAKVAESRLPPVLERTLGLRPTLLSQWCAKDAEFGNFAIEALERGARPYSNTESLLLAPCRAGDLRLVTALLDAGADPNGHLQGRRAASPEGTPLFHALESSSPNSEAVLDALIAAHADPNLFEGCESLLYRFMSRCEVRAVQWLAHHGARMPTWREDGVEQDAHALLDWMKAHTVCLDRVAEIDELRLAIAHLNGLDDPESTLSLMRH